jgi:hypothetical protein
MNVEKKVQIYEFLYACSREVLVCRLPNENLSKKEEKNRKSLRLGHETRLKEKIKVDPLAHQNYEDAEQHGAKFSLHLTLPRKFGGKDEKKNLVLVEETLHRYIHKFIHEQGKIAAGESKTILIPHMYGKLWVLPPNVEAPKRKSKTPNPAEIRARMCLLQSLPIPVEPR